MTHKFCFVVLDRSLAYIMGTTSKDSILFGGKVVVFGGDFRQILSDDSKRASFRYCTCDNQLILSLASM
ncbi:putative DNA helicase Pif1 [Lupinus albus]|uniref:ATP-dependent DNA helicase n=1 Tax=Lupinus albus TaxID=3870 RepID=A0A6A4QVX0_LUPAL|nr:putative DNA helicase Pif1 [Lupinus albus]